MGEGGYACRGSRKGGWRGPSPLSSKVSDPHETEPPSQGTISKSTGYRITRLDPCTLLYIMGILRNAVALYINHLDQSSMSDRIM